MTKTRQSAEKPPLMGDCVMAGFPSPAEQYVEQALDLNELLVKHPAGTFFVRAEGDSMIQAGIMPGDILVVDRALDAVDGSIVIAAVDGEFTVKYLRSKNNKLQLVAANPQYKPITFAGMSELQIFGVVTAAIRQFVKPGK
jgi:DNA polymerase V